MENKAREQGKSISERMWREKLRRGRNWEERAGRPAEGRRTRRRKTGAKGALHHSTKVLTEKEMVRARKDLQSGGARGEKGDEE